MASYLSIEKLVRSSLTEKLLTLVEAVLQISGDFERSNRLLGGEMAIIAESNVSWIRKNGGNN
jgi:hypothetical protein